MPTRPKVVGSLIASRSIETADAAAVLSAVIVFPARSALHCPVSGSNKKIEDWWFAIPFDPLFGQ